MAGGLLPEGDSRAARPGRFRVMAWDRVLVWFMRLMAAVWIAKGVLHWSAILGVGWPDPTPFEERGLAAQAATIAFAALDPVAAVGLWLTSSWGAVIWLLALTGEIIVGILPGSGIGLHLAVLLLDAVLVVSYLALSWLAGREPADAER